MSTPQLELADIVVFCTPGVLSSLTLAALHWFPWHGRGYASLSRIAAYTMGTLVVVGVPVATMLLTATLGIVYGQVFWAAVLVANMLVSGATVHLAYWIDSRRALTLEDAHHAQERR